MGTRARHDAGAGNRVRAHRGGGDTLTHHSPVAEQPSGTVTLVFSDIEGSTRLLEQLGEQAYREALAEHRLIMREAFGRHAGYEVDYEGDASTPSPRTARRAAARGEAMTVKKLLEYVATLAEGDRAPLRGD